MVKAVGQSAFGVVDFGQTFHAHPDEDVWEAVGEFNDFGGVVSVGAEFEKRGFRVEDFEYAVDVLSQCGLAAGDVDTESRGEFLEKRGLFLLQGVSGSTRCCTCCTWRCNER